MHLFFIIFLQVLGIWKLSFENHDRCENLIIMFFVHWGLNTLSLMYSGTESILSILLHVHLDLFMEFEISRYHINNMWFTTQAAGGPILIPVPPNHSSTSLLPAFHLHLLVSYSTRRRFMKKKKEGGSGIEKVHSFSFPQICIQSRGLIKEVALQLDKRPAMG